MPCNNLKNVLSLQQVSLPCDNLHWHRHTAHNRCEGKFARFFMLTCLEVWTVSSDQWWPIADSHLHMFVSWTSGVIFTLWWHKIQQFFLDLGTVSTSEMANSWFIPPSVCFLDISVWLCSQAWMFGLWVQTSLSVVLLKYPSIWFLSAQDIWQRKLNELWRRTLCCVNCTVRHFYTRLPFLFSHFLPASFG